MAPKTRARRAKAVVVGGSIAGLTCAHALISARWDVVVVEKSPAPPSGSPTGAGLGLDPQSRHHLSRWLSNPHIVHDSTLPLSIDLNRVTNIEKKIWWMVTIDEEFGFRAAHWADLHAILYEALPPGSVLWGHQYLSFRDAGENDCSVAIRARILQNGEEMEIMGDLLVAADGCLSAIRRHFLPDFKLRYSGYTAWRGVLDFSGKENSQTILSLRRAYPELGSCLYFDLAYKTHCVLYELKNKRMNWIWYQNMPEPEQKGSSVTMKVSTEMIEKMHEDAEKIWIPELAHLMSETVDPFINIIYDSDPLPKLHWGNVVLIGDAAHPTTPHGLRSTNMSIIDSAVLGNCVEKWGLEQLGMALKEYETIRVPVVSEQVLHARRIGRMKQGLVCEEKAFDPFTASPAECQMLQQRNMPYFEGVPTSI